MSEAKKSSLKNNLLFPAILLGLFTLVASAMLSTGDIGTKDAIEQRRAEDLKASIGQVIPENIHDNDLLESTITLTGPSGSPLIIYQAIQDDQVMAVAFTVSGYGYSGEITSIMAVDRTGKILGVRILSHTETPGLGDKVEVTKDDWVLGFNNRSIGNPSQAQWLVKKDGGYFDEFSGATITPRAVVKAVKEGLDFFAKHNEQLLNADDANDADQESGS